MPSGSSRVQCPVSNHAVVFLQEIQAKNAFDCETISYDDNYPEDVCPSWSVSELEWHISNAE